MVYTIVFLVVIIIYQAVKLIGLETIILDLEQDNDYIYTSKFNKEDSK